MKQLLTLFAVLFVLACPAYSNAVVSYNFAYQLGGSLPVPVQYALLSNAPGQVYSIRAVQNGSVYTWLWPSLNSVTAPATLTIAVNPVALPPGTYQGSFDVVGGAYDITFLVNLSVYWPPTGVFSVSPSALSFTVDSGSTGALPQSLFTYSTWAPVNYAVTTSSNWLSVAARAPSTYVPGSWTGTTPDQVSVFVNAATLQPGTYYGFVQFIANAATNSPFTVPVTLYVRPAPPAAIVVTPEKLTFSYAPGRSVAAQSLQVTLTSYDYSSAYTTLITSSDSWLLPEMQTANAPFMLRVNVNPGSLAPGTYTGRITITGPGWSGLSRVVPVDLVISADNQPAITSVRDAASSFSFVSPGSWLTITGRNFSTGSYRLAQPLPASLEGTSVQVGGVPAPLSYVSPDQINVYVPANLVGSTGNVAVTVLTSHGTASSSIDLHAVAPALFISVDNHAAAASADGVICGHQNPARPGAEISLYGAGFGEVNDSVAVPRALASKVNVYIGGRSATVHYAGLVGMGLYQFNVQVPSDLADGEHPVAVELAGTTSTYTQGGVVVPVQN